MFKGANVDHGEPANKIPLLAVKLIGMQAILFAVFGYPALVKLLERL